MKLTDNNTNVMESLLYRCIPDIRQSLQKTSNLLSVHLDFVRNSKGAANIKPIIDRLDKYSYTAYRLGQDLDTLMIDLGAALAKNWNRPPLFDAAQKGGGK